MINPTINNPRLLRGRHSCEACGSSDSLGYYEDHATCYGACDKTWFYDDAPKGKAKRVLEEIDFDEIIEGLKGIQGLPVRGSRVRGIYKDIYEFYGVYSEIKPDGEPGSRYYPWYRNNQLVTYKQKTLGKEFYLHGDTQIMHRKDCQLFGQQLFEAGGKMLVITEGEDDTCAVQQAYSKKYNGRRFPVVSLYNVNVDQVFINNLDWVNSFEKVVLWPDMDKLGTGLETMERYAKAIGPKAHIVGCKKYKDANDALLHEDASYLVNQIYNAMPYTPAGFVKGEELWNRFKERAERVSLPYPKALKGINEKLKGMRANEIVLFTSGTGAGKSTVTREVMIEIINNEETKLGIVSLEEEVGETVEKFLEMDLMMSFDDDSKFTEEEQRKSFDRLFASERVIVLDHQGSVGDSSLIEKLRALCAMGCTHVVLDHITIAVSEGNEGLSGNEAIDKMMSDLLKLVKGFPVWLGIIAHLRKVGSGSKNFEEGAMPSLDDIKGSGSIKQICFDIIAFARNIVAESEEERNLISMRVLKARTTGQTGNAGKAKYVNKRLQAVNSTPQAAVDELFKKEDKLEKEVALERIGL